MQRLTADLTGKAPDQHALTAGIAAAFRAGDHHGVLNAVAGATSASVSTVALLATV
ncbi:MAG: hypothetical protein ACJ8AI_06070 [Rhodopila sp.]